MRLNHPSLPRILLVTLLVLIGASSSRAGDKVLTFADLMKFRTIDDPVISDDGRWIAYTANPDRGDGEVVVRSTNGETEYRIERGDSPRLSSDGRWAAASIEPSLEEKEKARGKKGKGKKSKKDKPKIGLAWIDLESGEETRLEKIESFAFSENGHFLAYKRFREEESEEKDESEEKEESEKKEESEPSEQTEPEEAKTELEEAKTEGEDEEKDDEEDEEKNLGSDLVLCDLRSGEEILLEQVKDYAFDKPSKFLAYTVSAPKGEGNGAYLLELGGTSRALRQMEKGRFTHLTWAEGSKGHRMSLLALIEAPVEDGETGAGTVWTWDTRGQAQMAVSSNNVPEGWHVPSVNKMRWSRDGQRLFFGLKPNDEDDEGQEDEDKGSEDKNDEDSDSEDSDSEDSDSEDAEEPFDPYDLESLIKKREVDVWHWNDPLIQPHQKKLWKREKDRTYKAVFHRGTGGGESGRVVPLADLEVRNVESTDNPHRVLARADTPYLKEITWDGRLHDLYVIDLRSGQRLRVAERLRDDFDVSLSPAGRYVLYYDNDDDRDDSNGHWYLFDTESQQRRNITANLDIPFADEDHDYPTPADGYGMAEWLRDESAVLINDKFDIWSIPTSDAKPVMLTGGEGRKTSTRFRIRDLDPEEEALAPGAPLVLTAYHDREKHQALYGARVGQVGVRQLYGTGRHRVRAVARARDAGRLLFTRESYNEFPDLWTADLSAGQELPKLGKPRQLSVVNPQITDFAWGQPELVEWRSLDGQPLQGVLIKPGNYEPGRRYPVLVYYYRFFSQRLHEFNDPAVNHRPSFPVYASHDYAVFLPDIRFEVGRPGFAATKSLVPGVQKLIDLGIADANAIGLHGHSWSGYQTAFMITQTHLFKAAVAGAPVSNMTSAYSGIRHTTGLARQFQYEKTQSRIGGSLWDYPERYVENSPVFFADRIETPLLIQFGDEDGSVPWEQGVELYLALRRLGKECIFLQYRGEGHHLSKAANKLDYAVKMKEFFDHHLKGAPAPEWMTQGIAYSGE